jgi:hypothetical protein
MGACSARTPYAVRDAGEIEQVGRGLFRLATAPPLASPDLNRFQKANPDARLTVTIRGIVIRRRWPLVFWNSKGEYCCWGEGIDGGVAAVLVVTSTPIEDR